MSTLSTYFKGTASKYLSAVDATPRSNQHEIGSNKFAAILGNPGSEKLRFRTTFLFFNPDLEEPESVSDDVTYYDARLLQPGRSSEFRLYYRTNSITEQLQQGDFCLIGVRTDNTLLIAIARQGSDGERRLKYLFDVGDAREQWVIGEHVSKKELDLATRSIVEALGIRPDEQGNEDLEGLVEKFEMKFPTTREFSALAREKLGAHISAREYPDEALEEWMRQEERLFRCLERSIVELRLKDGFKNVDDFVSFSLSVQNRRKSRVGHALENHLEAIFKASGIEFERGAKTEGNTKPDFLFPGAAAYHNTKISSPPLQMLAAKSSCKDRWRQILTEAARIPKKYLCTLETAISTSQTDEMLAHSVCLVLPPSIANTFTPKQRKQVISIRNFVDLVG